MYLIIDIGNTRVKTAIFKNDTIYKLYHFKIDDFNSNIINITQEFSLEKAIISSVGNLKIKSRELIFDLFDTIELNSETLIPFTNNYATPNTLGVDRIALVSAAVHKYPNQNTLVIDAGTCITYDFVTKQKEYLGGAIAPGIESRYKSLHDYTQNLPLLEKKEPKSFIGNSSVESIHSGVINGVAREIDGVINQYISAYKKLTIVLTGGDAEFLSSQLKSSIFVRPFFLLEGLYTILKYNTDDKIF